MMTGSEVAAVRQQHGWSQQYLASVSGVNKPYISEYESGARLQLPAPMMEALEEALLKPPAGRVRARIEIVDGRSRLVLYDANNAKALTPDVASVHWTESDGTDYSIYLGKTNP